MHCARDREVTGSCVYMNVVVQYIGRSTGRALSKYAGTKKLSGRRNGGSRRVGGGGGG